MTDGSSRPVEAALDRGARLLNRPAVAGGAVAVVLLALLSYSPPADPDLFARVAVGRLVELNDGVVHRDPFAFTPRHDRWVDHEWLSGVVFYRVSGLGDAGLFAFTMAMMLGTLALVVRASAEHAGKGRTSLPWLLLTMLPAFGIWGSVVRSRVFTFALLAWMLLMLVRWRRRSPHWIWLVPPAFVPWANLHGGFVAGLGLLGMAAVAVTLAEPRRSPTLWAALVASTLVTLINPYGLEYWRYILGAVTMDRPLITEWQGLALLSLRGAWAVLLVVGFVVGGRMARHRPPPEAWALAATALVASTSSRRLLFFFLFVAAVYGGTGARALGRRARERAPAWTAAGRRVLAASFAGGTVYLLAVVGGNVVQVARTGLDYGAFPVDATRWLARHGEGGRLLVHFNHGSFALWRLYPHYLVSVDGRYEETYPQSTVDLSLAAIDPARPGHRAALARIDPDYVLLPDAGLTAGFGASWERVFDDGRFAVLARDRPDPGTDRPERPMWTPGF